MSRGDVSHRTVRRLPTASPIASVTAVVASSGRVAAAGRHGSVETTCFGPIAGAIPPAAANATTTRETVRHVRERISKAPAIAAEPRTATQKAVCFDRAGQLGGECSMSQS